MESHQTCGARPAALGPLVRRVDERGRVRLHHARHPRRAAAAARSGGGQVDQRGRRGRRTLDRGWRRWRCRSRPRHRRRRLLRRGDLLLPLSGAAQPALRRRHRHAGGNGARFGRRPHLDRRPELRSRGGSRRERVLHDAADPRRRGRDGRGARPRRGASASIRRPPRSRRSSNSTARAPSASPSTPPVRCTSDRSCPSRR